MSNDGSSIEIIDRSHGDEAVHGTVRNATSDNIILLFEPIAQANIRVEGGKLSYFE